MTLLDDLMPAFDVRKRYQRPVRAGAAQVWEALKSFDVAADTSAATKTLLRLRGLRPQGGTGLGAFAGSRFTVLAEQDQSEIVVAIAGKFWALREQAALDPIRDAAHAASYAEPGRAVALWSFEIEPKPDGRSVLATETRVRCVDDKARRTFKAYWTFVEPFSGMIRRDMLRSIARKAEAS